MKSVEPIIEKLNRAREGLEAAVRAVPSNRWREPPRTGVWAAAEVIAHVTMVEQRITKTASKLLEAPPLPAPFWKRFHLPAWLGQWRGIRVKTPIPLDSSLVSDREEMLARLTAVREHTLKLMAENCNRDLGAYRSPHPFLGSLNVYDWFKTLAYHDVRHAKQIREIVDFFQR